MAVRAGPKAGRTGPVAGTSGGWPDQRWPSGPGLSRTPPSPPKALQPAHQPSGRTAAPPHSALSSPSPALPALPTRLPRQAILVTYSIISILVGRDHGWVVTQRAQVAGGQNGGASANSHGADGAPTAAGGGANGHAALAASPAGVEAGPVGPGLSHLSPFRKPSAGEDDGEPTLGFTLTRYYTADRPDSVAQGLSSLGDCAGEGDAEAGKAAGARNGVGLAMAAASRKPQSGAQYQQML